jgi:hypothetical protein
MWDHLPDAEAEAAQRWVAEGKYPLVSFGEEPGLRWFFVDGEEMAEGGVARVLRELAPGLATCGIELQIETVNEPIMVEDGGYVVAINGRRCVVWRPEDWPAQRPWEVSTVRPLAVINDLLADVGATKRLFTLGAGGNEGIAWLIDPRIAAAIADSGLVQESGLPVLAISD